MRRIAGVISVVGMVALSAFADAADALPVPSGPVLLSISGDIGVTNAPGLARFDRDMLENLGQQSFTSGSALSDKAQLFEGVPLKAILDRVGAKGSEITASALNDYVAVIPMDDLRFGPLIALRVDGQELKLRDKGPLWIVYPRDDYRDLKNVRYDSRWVWQLNRLHIE